MSGISGGFFKNRIPELQGREERAFINVGGKQFNAAAVALMDYLKSNAAVSDAILKKILAGFQQYFPQLTLNNAKLTPKERIARLLTNPRKSELVECMAYVLRQLAVDEIYENPLDSNYRSIFSQLHGDTPKSHLRNPDISLPLSAFNALSRALSLSIALSFKEPGKELRRREVIGGDFPSTIAIQVQGEDYFPGVKRKTDFTHVGQTKVSISPVENPQDHEDSLMNIFNEIYIENQELLRACKKERDAILSMVTADGLTEELLSLYIKLLPPQSNHASFILSLMETKEPVVTGIPVESSAKNNVTLFVNVFAIWVVSNPITREQLCEGMENTQSPALT